MGNAGKGEFTLGYIDAAATYDFVMEVRLQGQNALASSYLGYNAELMFQISDDNGVMRFMGFEMLVEDNFGVLVTGSGNHDVDNGCTDQEKTVSWDVDVRNMGNTADNFDVTFNTDDAVAASWSVSGTDDGNTGSISPKAEGGVKSYSISMTVPNGLAADTKHGFTMTVTSVGDSTETQTQEFSATVLQCYGISMTVDKTTDSANPGESADYTVTVTNTGNGEDTVSYMTMGAQTWNPTLSEMNSTIASGATGQVIFSMTVPALSLIHI